MNKEMRRFLNEQIADYMRRVHPDYPKVSVKLAGTSFTGCCVYSKKAGERRQAWVVIGGEQHGESANAVLYWTTEGRTWEDLTDWNAANNLPPPATGGVHLTDERVAGDDLFDGSRLIWLNTPPESIQRKALAEIKKTDRYRKTREMLANEMRRKDPSITDDEIDAKQEHGHCVSLTTWSGIDRAIEWRQDILDVALGPVIRKIEYLVTKKGVPFLEERLRT